MDELMKYLSGFEGWEAAGEQIISRHAFEARLEAHDILLEPEHIPEALGFVSRGVLIATRAGGDRQERISHFIVAGDFVTDIDDFLKNRPTRVMVEAAVDSQIVFLKRETIRLLAGTLPQWDALWNKIATVGLLETVRRRSPVAGVDPKGRFLDFIQRYPGLVDQIPNKIVALYLDMNSATLSRIRGKCTA